MSIQDRIDEVEVILNYLNTIVPYIINCNPIDHGRFTTYSIDFGMTRRLPTDKEVDSLINVLSSISGKYENSLLISEFKIILNKIKKGEENEDG